jgi:hypothetical protein
VLFGMVTTRRILEIVIGNVNWVGWWAYYISPDLTSFAPQPPHKPPIARRFPWSECFARIFRNEGVTGSNPVSSTDFSLVKAVSARSNGCCLARFRHLPHQATETEHSVSPSGSRSDRANCCFR